MRNKRPIACTFTSTQLTRRQPYPLSLRTAFRTITNSDRIRNCGICCNAVWHQYLCVISSNIMYKNRDCLQQIHSILCRSTKLLDPDPQGGHWVRRRNSLCKVILSLYETNDMHRHHPSMLWPCTVTKLPKGQSLPETS